MAEPPRKSYLQLAIEQKRKTMEEEERKRMAEKDREGAETAALRGTYNSAQTMRSVLENALRERKRPLNEASGPASLKDIEHGGENKG